MTIMLPVVTGFRLSKQNRFYEKLFEETRKADKKLAFNYVGDFNIDKNVNRSSDSDEILLDVNDQDLRSTYELVKAFNKTPREIGYQEREDEEKSNHVLNDFSRNDFLLGNVGRDESRDSDTTEGSHGCSEISSQPYLTSPSHIASTETSPREDYDIENELSEEEPIELNSRKPKGLTQFHRSISLDNKLAEHTSSTTHDRSQRIPYMDLLMASNEQKTKEGVFPDFVLPSSTSPRIHSVYAADHSKSIHVSSGSHGVDATSPRYDHATPRVNASTPRSDRSTPRAERGKETITRNYKTIINELQQKSNDSNAQTNKNTNTKIIEIPLDSLVNIRLMAPQKNHEVADEEPQHPRQQKMFDYKGSFDTNVPLHIPKKFCKFCKQSVRPHEQYLYGDEVMHRHCMKCAECQIPLQNADQKEDKYGNLFCFRCFMTINGNKSVLWT